MSKEHLSEARRHLMDFAVRAVAVARTASATAAKAAATANDAAAKAKAAAATTAGRSRVSEDADSACERDETIAPRDQEVEAERAKTEELAEAVKAFEFKLEILERSYEKQLADARADEDAAKRELSELKTLLADTKQELKRVTAIKDRLQDMLAFDGRRVPPELRDQPGAEDTIAKLLALANTMPDERSTPGESSQEPPDSEPEAGDLLSPELVFAPKDEKE